MEDTTAAEQQCFKCQYGEWEHHNPFSLSCLSHLDLVGLETPALRVLEERRARNSYQDPGSPRRPGREIYAHSKEQRIYHILDSLRVHVLFNSMFIIISLRTCHKWGRESIIENLWGSNHTLFESPCIIIKKQTVWAISVNIVTSLTFFPRCIY